MGKMDPKNLPVIPLKRFFFLVIIPVLLLINLIFYRLYTDQKNREIFIFENKAKSTLLAQKKILEQFTNKIYSDLNIILNHHELLNFISTEQHESQKYLVHDLIQFAKFEGVYDQIRYIDEQGMEKIRINFHNGRPVSVKKGKLQNKKNRYYFKDSIKLNKDEIFMSPMDLNIENGKIEIPLKPMIRIGAPIFDEKGEKKGIVIVNYLSRNLLNVLSDEEATTPHLMMLNRNGYFLKGLSRNEEWGFMYEEKKHLTFQNKFPDSWNLITSSDKGSFINKLGLFSFNTIFPMKEKSKSSNGASTAFESSKKAVNADEYQWKIVCFVTKDIFNKKLEAFKKNVVILDVMISFIVIIITWFLAVSSHRKKKAEFKLKIAHDELEFKVMKRTHDVSERMKELKCLYTISTLHENRNISTEEFFQSIANTIPPAWQYPKITCAQIVINKNQYKTDNFKKTKWKQCCNILITGEIKGAVEVYYSKEMPTIDEGPFSKEERALLNEIAERISRFIERVEAEEKNKKLEIQIRQSQKLEAIGTLAGGIAHDFNNILMAIMGFAQLILADVKKGSDTENDIQEIMTAGLRARDLINQVLVFARQSDEELIPMRVDLVAKEVLKLIRSSIPTSITIKSKIESKSMIIGNPTQCHQIFMNLCTNAAYAMEQEGGVLEVSLLDIDIKDCASIIQWDLNVDQYIKIVIKDTGAGISENDIKLIFDPYFTTKPLGEGTGMGLSVVHGIVESYQGKIFVDSTPKKGTEFTIFIPITKRSKKNVSEYEKAIPTGTEHILVVDDEISITKVMDRMLTQLGYSTTKRNSGIKALELFKLKPNYFDLVITDMTMPNITGDKLAIEMIAIRPNIPVILCTGYSKHISDEKASEIGIKALINKPIVSADLAKTIRAVLDDAKKIS